MAAAYSTDRPMIVRSAGFGNDVLAVADLIYGLANGKTTEHLCRSRVDQCVKRSRSNGPGLRVALVVTEGEKIRGFLYAEERQLFDLCPNVRVVEVPFLVGSHGAAVPLLTRLREMTKLRIWIQNMQRQRAFARLLRPLSPESVAMVYQV